MLKSFDFFYFTSLVTLYCPPNNNKKTFGGCVVTAATMQELQPDVFRNRQVARLDMKVDYTTSRKVDGLNGLPLFGDIIWKIKVSSKIEETLIVVYNYFLHQWIKRR